MRDRGIELVQVLLERRAQQQHVVGRVAASGQARNAASARPAKRGSPDSRACSR